MIKRNILSLIFIPYIRLYIHNYEISPTLPKYHYWKFTMKKIRFFRWLMKPKIIRKLKNVIPKLFQSIMTIKIKNYDFRSADFRS